MNNATENEVMTALQEYKAGDKTTAEIADKRGVSKSTISVWARNANLPRRHKGRRPFKAPSVQHQKILEMVACLPMEEVGRRLGMSKQNVHRVVKRWRTLELPKRPPFEIGQRIRWGGKEYTVKMADLHSGTVVDENGRDVKNFHWRMPYRGKVCYAKAIEEAEEPPAPRHKRAA